MSTHGPDPRIEPARPDKCSSRLRRRDPQYDPYFTDQSESGRFGSGEVRRWSTSHAIVSGPTSEVSNISRVGSSQVGSGSYEMSRVGSHRVRMLSKSRGSGWFLSTHLKTIADRVGSGRVETRPRPDVTREVVPDPRTALQNTMKTSKVCGSGILCN